MGLHGQMLLHANDDHLAMMVMVVIVVMVIRMMVVMMMIRRLACLSGRSYENRDEQQQPEPER